MTKLSRRRFMHFAAAAAGLRTIVSFAWAQAYPTRPVRVIVPFPPGGVTDTIARPMAQWLSDRLHKPFIIENRPGAGTNIGTEAAVRAPPDGHTLLLASSANAINATLYDKLSFDFIRDVAPVAGIVRLPIIMVVISSFPGKTVPEFIAYAKANPGKINMATAGPGSTLRMFGELFQMMTGTSLTAVSYRGGSAAFVDLLSGQVQVMFGPLSESIGHIRSGELRALAVTGATRSAILPDVPTVGESVPGYETDTWYGIGAPKNTPAEIVTTLNAEINAGLADAKMQERFADLGGVPLAMSPAEFGTFLAEQTDKWAKVIAFAGIKPE